MYRESIVIIAKSRWIFSGNIRFDILKIQIRKIKKEISVCMYIFFVSRPNKANSKATGPILIKF